MMRQNRAYVLLAQTINIMYRCNSPQGEGLKVTLLFHLNWRESMRPKSRLVVVSLLVALSMVLALVVTPGLQHSVARAAGSTFSVGFAQEPDVLNGNYTNMAFGVWAVYLMQANLWDYDNKLQAVPVLVNEIPTSA